MTRFCIIFSLLLSLPFLSFSQNEDRYDTEVAVGINFNTNGGIIGGVMGKYTRKDAGRRYTYFGLEIVNVKDLKESRTYSNTGNLFIEGKMNYLFSVRPQYGKEFIVFRSAEEEGVQVNFTAAAGPTIGILKPYYIVYNYGSGITAVEPYDPETHSISSILGSGGFMKGFGNSKIKPGIHAKGSLFFTFGQSLGNLTGIEAGGLIEVFPSKINLLNTPHQRNIFTSIFLNITFGQRN
jgi:hypothetical protein